MLYWDVQMDIHFGTAQKGKKDIYYGTEGVLLFKVEESRLLFCILFITVMAEEIIKLPTTPDSLRRNSAGNSNSSNSGGKIIPHYLRASTGSCHDHCKYGKKHAFEKDARRPIRKKMTTPPPAPVGQNSVEILVMVDRKKTATVKLKPSSDSKTLIGESTKLIKEKVSSHSNNLEVPLKQVASNTKETTPSPKLATSLKPKPTTVKPVSSPNSSADPSGRRNSNANNSKEPNVLGKCVTSLKPKAVTVKSSSSASAPGGSSGGRDSNIKIGRKTGTSKVTVKKVLTPPIASLSSKPSVSRVASLNARKNKGLKIMPPLKNQNKIRRAEPKHPSNKNVLEKNLYVIKMETEDKTFLSVENRSPDEINALVSVENKSPDENKTSMPVENKSPDDNTLVIVENSSPDENKTFMPVENRSPDRNKSLESAEIRSPTVRSTPSLLSPKSSPITTSPSVSSDEEYDLVEFGCTDSEADDSISEDDETVDMGKIETLEGEYKRSPRKARLVLSEDKDGNPVKLSFRRGKVVDLQSESKGPRRLRFRRGRVLGENENGKGEARRRSFKKREEINGDGANPGSEKVVLRHQDVQGKKDAQGLFNNVIKETASKLVEARRSRVKALVGAFESVISLQDSKPTTTNTIS